MKKTPVSGVSITRLISGDIIADILSHCIVDDGSTVLESRIKHIEVQVEEKTSSSPVKKNKQPVPKEIKTIKKPPFDIPPIGSTVRVMGKIRRGFPEGRMIRIDQLSESLGLFSVFLSLHDTAECPYGGIEEAKHWKHVIELHKTKYSQPFTLPTRNPAAITIPETPKKTTPTPVDESTPRPQAPTPQPRDNSPESVRSVVSVEPPELPLHERTLKLRHPSRVRRHNLDTKTFRLYLKYFMDNIYALEECDCTPTKRRRSRRSSAKEGLDGFGLSYLLRVPELRDLAIRTVKEERKREEQRKLAVGKENIRHGSSSTTSKPKRPINFKRDTKRLFGEALRMLLQDGMIVIQEGRSRRWDDREASTVEKLHMWKHKDSQTQASPDKSKTLATISEISVASVAEEEFALSDVDEDEECFIPVTSRLLSTPLLSAIKIVTAHLNGARLRSKRPKVIGAPEEDILEQLHNTDERWSHIWDIGAALKKLQQEDEVYMVSEGVWAILT